MSSLDTRNLNGDSLALHDVSEKDVKVLFIVPMHITFESFVSPGSNVRSYKKSGKFYNLPPTDLPLGFLSMSAFLKKHTSVDIKLIDLNVEVVEIDEFPYQTFFEFASDFLKKTSFTPDIVGISSLFSPSYQNFLETGAAAKEVYPNALIVGGGNIPTSAYSEIYSSNYADSFDALCYGEGELPMLELVKSNDVTNYLSQSNCWVTKEKIKGSFAPKHNFIENLDEIPFYDYELCDIERHNSNLVVSSFASSEKLRSFHVMTSRGCPFKCTFCASHAVHGRTMRFHSLRRVQEDFSKLKEKYGAKVLIFQDDHFMSDKDRVYAILGYLKGLSLQSIYQSGLALYALDRQMLEAFYSAGVRQLVLAVESGSERVLKELMRKPLKLEISQRVANDCRDLGIYTNTNILIGMPGETKEDIEEARRNLSTINSNWFHINCASPLVGSEMHTTAVRNGYIRGETLGADYKVAAIETPQLTIEYVQDMQYIMNLELNFVNNVDMRFGHYDIALKGFENVIAIKPDHAFAYFFAAQCCRKLGVTSKAQIYAEHFEEYAEVDFWKRFVEMFDLGSVNANQRDSGMK